MLWRHGKAESDSASGRDEDRELTAHGIKGVAAAARFLKKEGRIPQRIYSSPYLRARQTAEAAQDELACPGGVALFPALESGAEPEDILKALAREKDLPDRFALVGHMPDLGMLAEFFVGGPDRIRLSPGEFWLIEARNLKERGKGKKRLRFAPDEA